MTYSEHELEFTFANKTAQIIAKKICQQNLSQLKDLQGSVATCVNYGRIFIDSFTANLLQSVMEK